MDAAAIAEETSEESDDEEEELPPSKPSEEERYRNERILFEEEELPPSEPSGGECNFVLSTQHSFHPFLRNGQFTLKTFFTSPA